MALPLYLAMTAAEIRDNVPLPPKFAYMACHFSSYGTGISNCPQFLPPGSMLILNDRIPIRGHDPRQITDQLLQMIDAFQYSSLLLDFQRPDREETAILAKMLYEALPCSVGLSEVYGQVVAACPVFLPPPPPDTALADYIAPWQGREIWLEAALDGMRLTLTPQDCTPSPLAFHSFSDGFEDTALHCHYRIETGQNQADFFLWRTREDLCGLFAEAETLGITRAIGLWQELN